MHTPKPVRIWFSSLALVLVLIAPSAFANLHCGGDVEAVLEWPQWGAIAIQIAHEDGSPSSVWILCNTKGTFDDTNPSSIGAEQCSSVLNTLKIARISGNRVRVSLDEDVPSQSSPGSPALTCADVATWKATVAESVLIVRLE